jgi:hypothetical protein
MVQNQSVRDQWLFSIRLPGGQLFLGEVIRKAASKTLGKGIFTLVSLQW